ncbi:hypothetical protein AB205_0186660, partial [Aquarana catesbeiana]
PSELIEPEPHPPLPNNFIPQDAASNCNPSEHFPLRRTASEPNLKWPCRPKKSGERRKNPLTRKESAPPAVRRRPPETQDSSPSSSSTPVSGCSSPNDSLAAENGSLSSLPGAASEEMERRTMPSLIHRVPHLTHPTVYMPGLSSVPLQFTHPLISPDHLSATGHHKALSRTRSEPLPQNTKTLQQQLLLQQQYAAFPEYLKRANKVSTGYDSSYPVLGPLFTK